MRNTTAESVNLYFGQQQRQTLRKFDQLSQKIRRSRTQTLDYLLEHYAQSEKARKLPNVIPF